MRGQRLLRVRGSSTLLGQRLAAFVHPSVPRVGGLAYTTFGSKNDAFRSTPGAPSRALRGTVFSSQKCHLLSFFAWFFCTELWSAVVLSTCLFVCVLPKSAKIKIQLHTFFHLPEHSRNTFQSTPGTRSGAFPEALFWCLRKHSRDHFVDLPEAFLASVSGMCSVECGFDVLFDASLPGPAYYCKKKTSRK